MSLTLTGLFRYPVKSCRGESVDSAVVEPWGLAGDRRWMLVDAAGKFVSAREYPRLLLIRTSVDDESIRLSRPDGDVLVLTPPSDDGKAPVSIWGDEVLATPSDNKASAWFSAIVGKPVMPVYLDDPTRRPTNPEHSHESDRVSFADGYPLLMTTQGSLDQLNAFIADGPAEAEGPLPMMRFRPSVVVSGSQAWDEDGWQLLRIGAVLFRSAKGCARCVMTTIDPDTAVKGKEPLATLGRYRRWDSSLWFGTNLIPDSLTPGATLNIGDEVEIVERAS